MFQFRSNIVALALLCLALVLPTAPAAASGESDAGVTATSAALTLFYGPAKLLYSGLGILVGGMA